MELRARIASIEETHRLLEELGGKKLATYGFEDRVYFLPGETSLEKGYIRIRSPSPEEKDQRYKTVKKIIQEGKPIELFRSFSSSLELAKAKVQGHWIACILVRKGSKWQLGNGFLFVEEIEEYGNSVEAEYASEMEAREWLHQLNANEITTYSLPLQFMIRKNSQNPN